MTTQVQIQRLVRPLARSFPELVPMKNGAVIVPMAHLFRKVEVEPSRGGDRFKLGWTVWPLFCKYAVFPFTFSEPVFSRDKVQWKCSSENVGHFLQKEVEDVCLPSLKSIETIDQLCNIENSYISFDRFFTSDDRFGIFIDAARGDLNQAEARCERVLSQAGMDHWTKYELMRLEYDNIVNVFYPLLRARDPKAIGDQMRAWECDTLRALKLEQYWQPTPFPFEEEE